MGSILLITALPPVLVYLLYLPAGHTKGCLRVVGSSAVNVEGKGGAREKKKRKKKNKGIRSRLETIGPSRDALQSSRAGSITV